MKFISKDEFIENFSDENFEDIKSNIPSVIKFTAEWCGPCKMMNTTLEKLEKENTNVNFFQIDVDEEIKLAEVFKIRSIPTTLFINDDGIQNVKHGAINHKELSTIIGNIIK